MYRLSLTVMVGLTLLLAACSGAPANSSPAADATADQDGRPTAAETGGEDDGSASETEDAGDDGAGGANPGGATDLEALLPDEVNGVQLTKSSFSGEQIETAGFSLDDLVAAAGVSPDDISLAMANDQSGGQISIIAIRIEGRSGEQALEALLESDTTGLAEAVREATVGGKEVLVSEIGGAIYLYAADDVVFELLADEASAEDALSQLP